MAWPTCREEERNIVHMAFGLTIESLLWLMGIFFTALLLLSGVVIYGAAGVLLAALLTLVVYVPTLLIPGELQELQFAWVGLSVLGLLVLAYRNPYGIRDAALLISAGVVMVAIAGSMFLIIVAWPLIFQFEQSSAIWQPFWILVLCYSLSIGVRLGQPLKTATA